VSISWHAGQSISDTDCFVFDLVLATFSPQFYCVMGIWSEYGGMVAARIVAGMADGNHRAAMIDRHDNGSLSVIEG
jgi:hypothetical protein